ncbi:ankyrin repeat-containing domain protein [Fusarium oxysporum]|nr:ankyrin repeat-containing domain protein [Fusarium oxysporum]
MSPQICVAGRPLTLTNFPPEIINLKIDRILDENSLHKEESWEWDYWPEPEPEHNPLQVYVDALNLAATCKDIRRLVTKQIYIRDARDNHSAALLVSAKRNDIAGVIRALHIGANIHSDDATETVTYYTTGPNAIKTGHRVPLQLENQATAIHWAAFNGHKEIVSLLLNHGASINHRVSIDARLRYLGSPQAVDNQYRFMKLEQGANTLYFAVEGGNIDIAESLIKAGADLMTHTGIGLTALHQAVSNGDLSMAKDLLMEGIDPNSADPFGKTPLHFIKCSEEEMHRADINRWDLLGNTPLLTHLQDFERNDSVIAEFIRQGAHIYEGFYDDLEAPLNELNQEIYNRQVPEGLAEFSPKEWEESWEKRPFVYVDAPLLGNLI